MGLGRALSRGQENPGATLHWGQVTWGVGCWHCPADTSPFSKNVPQAPNTAGDFGPRTVTCAPVSSAVPARPELRESTAARLESPREVQGRDGTPGVPSPHPTAGVRRARTWDSAAAGSAGTPRSPRRSRDTVAARLRTVSVPTESSEPGTPAPDPKMVVCWHIKDKGRTAKARPPSLCLCARLHVSHPGAFDWTGLQFSSSSDPD